MRGWARRQLQGSCLPGGGVLSGAEATAASFQLRLEAETTGTTVQCQKYVLRRGVFRKRKEVCGDVELSCLRFDHRARLSSFSNNPLWVTATHGPPHTDSPLFFPLCVCSNDRLRRTMDCARLFQVYDKLEWKDLFGE